MMLINIPQNEPCPVYCAKLPTVWWNVLDWAVVIPGCSGAPVATEGPGTFLFLVKSSRQGTRLGGLPVDAGTWSSVTQTGRQTGRRQADDKQTDKEEPKLHRPVVS